MCLNHGFMSAFFIAASIAIAGAQTKLLSEPFDEVPTSPPWSFIAGTPSISSVQAHSTPTSYHIDENLDMLMFSFDEAVIGEARAWIYDDVSKPLACMFAIHGPGVFASLGVFQKHAAGTYLLRWEISGNGPLIPSEVPRTTGWHEFKIATDGTVARLFIDGVEVLEVAGIGSFTAISFGDGWSDTGDETFVDDVLVSIPATGPREIAIDIKPGSDANSINLKSNGLIPVAVLGSAGFDLNEVDMITVAFGPAHAAPAHGGYFENVNNDNYMDLVFHFQTRETGLSANDTEAALVGQTSNGEQFIGTDAVGIVLGSGKGKSGKPAATFGWGQVKSLQQ